MILLPIYVLLCTSLTVDYDTFLNGNPTYEISLRPSVLSARKITFSLRKLKELVYTIYFLCAVGPLLSGHPPDFENWPLNRGWPFNRGIEYCSLETLK